MFLHKKRRKFVYLCVLQLHIVKVKHILRTAWMFLHKKKKICIPLCTPVTHHKSRIHTKNRLDVSAQKRRKFVYLCVPQLHTIKVEYILRTAWMSLHKKKKICIPLCTPVTHHKSRIHTKNRLDVSAQKKRKFVYLCVLQLHIINVK